MPHAQRSRLAHQRNGGTLARVAASAAGTIKDLTGHTSISSRERIRRESGISADEALALAAYRRYAFEKRTGKDAPACKYEGNRGRPKNRPSAAIWDARIVRGIDFERCLTRIGPFHSTILKLYYVDGETLETVSASTNRCTRTLQGDLADARQALAMALEVVNLL